MSAEKNSRLVIWRRGAANRRWACARIQRASSGSSMHAAFWLSETWLHALRLRINAASTRSRLALLRRLSLRLFIVEGFDLSLNIGWQFRDFSRPCVHECVMDEGACQLAAVRMRFDRCEQVGDELLIQVRRIGSRIGRQWER